MRPCSLIYSPKGSGHMIEMNTPSANAIRHKLPIARGWDRNKRLWQIYEGENPGNTRFWASNGESYMYANTLEEIGKKLDA